MKYNQLPPFTQQELARITKDPYNFLNCMQNPSYFSHHVLGITPYRYQHLILRRFRDKRERELRNDRMIICKSRQIGISICLAILAIWYAAYNKANDGMGTSIHHNTKVGIISRSDDQAKKLMKEIQNMVWNSKFDFSQLVKSNRQSPLNKKEIHFSNGLIKCFPPTDASRGESFDLLIVDEAAFVDGEVFKDAMEPTVSAVDGKIILSSTPKGQSGFYFELFDPYDIKKNHEYERFWFHWKMCENEAQKRIIKEKFINAKAEGNIKSFDQEYNALFTVDEESFFEDADVQAGIDKSSTPLFEFKEHPCTVGIDYGISRSATCITITTKIKNCIKLIYQYARVGLDDNLLMDNSWEHSIPNLLKRYNVVHIVVDDCAQGNTVNRWLENEGYPVIRFNFRSDTARGERNRGYYRFRSELKQGRLRYPELRTLLAEMKCLQEVRMEQHMKIKAPNSYKDDRIDSFMMSCWPFLNNEGKFTSAVVDYDEAMKSINKNRTLHDGRFDEKWDNYINEHNDYNFMLK